MKRTPVMRLFRWLSAAHFVCAFFCAAQVPAADAASISIRLVKVNGQPLAGAVLTLEPPQGQRAAPVAPVHSIVDQVDLTFVPDLIVVPVGSTVSFPNSDAVSHQVYSFSSTKRFQLPLYRGKPYPPVTFDQPGVVTLGCNIHDNMLAYVVVTGAPFFGRTDASGEWSVPDAPVGQYRLKLWHPLLNEPAASLERSIDVTSAPRTEALVRLTKALRPAPLSSRPHSWDY